jgi:hypothetical protein
MSRFAFYERVEVRSSDPKKAAINERLAVVVGNAQDDTGNWWYGVLVYDLGHVWYCAEAELVSTGEFDSPEAHAPVGALRVSSKGEVLGEGVVRRPSSTPKG